LNSSLLKKIKERTQILSRDQGFDLCGISKADFLEEEAPRLEEWLNQGMHGEMKYMENWFDLRLDPRKLVDGAKTVITVLQNYFPLEAQKKGSYLISKYAYGEDYHFVLKRKLKSIALSLKEEFGDFNWRSFVDSAPVMDRVWAKKGGLGWIGKNSLLLNKERGSFLFIGHLIADLEMETDSEVSDHCGTCTKCIDACPTGAITEPYKVDGSKCISYLTIELKDTVPEGFKKTYEDWIFGCDICQDVCPWSSKALPSLENSFTGRKLWMDYDYSEWENLTEQAFKEQFRDSALKRTGYLGLKRNIQFLNEKDSV
jgi:epoxyqueuosine reductase